MEWLPKCAELEMVVGACNWLDMMIVYCREFESEHRDFALQMNRLIGQMNEACQDRIAFVRELESFTGKEAKERALEIQFFLQKLMRDESS
ncbi:hypothetical protein Tco_0273502 [Tanacetum coccineum]